KLTELKLIELKDNRYTPLKTSFKVPDSFGDLGLEAFYVQNLEAAKEAIKLPKEKRRFKSIFIPLNPDEFSEFNDSFQAFVNEHLHKYNTDNYADRALYQVHFNMIPAAEPLE
ncbi:MAG: DUF4423 domain-containing protein, partial [Bdellovibrio sp.]|nr:DUF4423 domain-containing protein [Bdellovibrio sp.]